jgi:hypothetical protein
VKKDEIISTSATATPPVQEIRYTSQYVNTANSTVTPVMSYAPPAAFTAPIDQGGAIYHTGVSRRKKTKIIQGEKKTF